MKSSVADNQQGVGLWLANHGAVELADARADDFDATFDRAFTGLVRNPIRLRDSDPGRILDHSVSGMAKIGPRYAVNRFCHRQRLLKHTASF